MLMDTGIYSRETASDNPLYESETPGGYLFILFLVQMISMPVRSISSRKTQKTRKREKTRKERDVVD